MQQILCNVLQHLSALVITILKLKIVKQIRNEHVYIIINAKNFHHCEKAGS